ncbi:hypothetical protein Leryth_008956 [Lithospermum erythrorhizon]|nr:hypothetical protein Leryth_008956 [Lithospermum erythrorhizon]
MLSENNFVIWNRAIKMALCAKQKLGFIDDRLKKNRNLESYLRYMENDRSHVRSPRILNSISPGGETKNFLENVRVLPRNHGRQRSLSSVIIVVVKGLSFCRMDIPKRRE